jgi:hypothetical protein
MHNTSDRWVYLPLAWKCCHCLDVMMGVGLDAVDPVVRDVLADEVVAAFVVGLCAEEAGDGGEVRCVAGGHEFVEKSSLPVRRQAQRAVVEVRVVLFGLVVALQATFDEIFEVVVRVAGLGHHGEEVELS